VIRRYESGVEPPHSKEGGVEPPHSTGGRLMIWAAAAMLLAGAVHAAGPAPVRPPHLVLFVSDDHTWHDCGPYGAPDVRTPNLDRLAREGMRFGAAFAASPTCTPSRSALYTGLYPFRNGAHANHSLVRDELRTLPHRMKDLGYRVVLAGKTHTGPRPLFPFEYLQGSNVMPPGKNHVLWTDLNTAAVDRLLAEHDRKQPLCLVVCSHSPHVYWPENDGYDPARLKLPPNLLDTAETRAARCRYYTDVTWMDKQVGEVRESLAKHGYERDTLFVYTADQGAQFPFGKWNLYDAGIRAPLLASWPGKVKAGSATKALVSLVDLLPTFIEAGGGKAPRELDGWSFLPVLLRKTKRHRGEVYASHTGDGQMNRSPMRGLRTDRYKYILNLKPETVYKTHISEGASEDGKSYWTSWVRLAETDERAARVVQRFRHRPAEELYDLKKDPWEQENLAGDPARAAVLVLLREKLKAWRLQQGEDLTRVPMPEDARKGEILYAR
jgi:arylsulfatase A-like enzyme